MSDESAHRRDVMELAIKRSFASRWESDSRKTVRDIFRAVYENNYNALGLVPQLEKALKTARKGMKAIEALESKE